MDKHKKSCRDLKKSLENFGMKFYDEYNVKLDIFQPIKWASILQYHKVKIQISNQLGITKIIACKL